MRHPSTSNIPRYRVEWEGIIRSKENFDADRADNKHLRRSLKRTEEYLKRLKRIKFNQEVQLHHAEVLLPENPLRRAYHKIRENPKWYLCPGLTRDCISRGGCCARECRCCERRCVARGITGAWTPGIGHCTPVCSCCNESRGFSVDEEQRNRAAKGLIKRVSAFCPAYLQTLCDPYFAVENPPTYDQTR